MNTKKSVLERQETWLFACLKRHAKTYYGKRYGFEKINTIAAYQKAVPLVDYETIAPLIERISNGEANVLFYGNPVAFEITGGSLGGGKLIPYTKESFVDFQRAIVPWFSTIAQRYNLTCKAAYYAISPALRAQKTTPCGIKIGVSDAAYLGEDAGAIMADGVVVPSWVGELTEITSWQLATLYWLIRAQELELISIWSPTFLLMLLDALDEHADALLKLFYQGSSIAKHTLAPDVQAAKRLKKYLTDKKSEQLWPQLKLISCWQDASSKAFARRLQERFPNVAFQPKALIATEGIVSMPSYHANPLLNADNGFFEFLDANQEVHLADALIVGAAYEVVMTTNGGLYRYKTGDLVRFEGHEETLPILRFIGRSGIVSDMVGEKLTEAFVHHALDDTDGFSMLVAQYSDVPHYLLLGETQEITTKIKSVEAKLCNNPQYAYARKIGQLGSLKACVVANAWQRYIEYKTMLGSRIGDIKIPALQTDKAWLHIIQEAQI